MPTATKSKAQAVKHGDKVTNIVFSVQGMLLATLAVTQREVKLYRGKTETGTEIEKFDHPQYVLADFRPVKEGKNPKHGIRGMRGSILGADLTPDASLVGEVAIVIDGKATTLTLVPGLAGKEGDAKRNPKLDLGRETVRVTIGGVEYRVSFGVSQTAPNKRFFWGSVKPMSERKAKPVQETSDEDLMDLADLAL